MADHSFAFPPRSGRPTDRIKIVSPEIKYLSSIILPFLSALKIQDYKNFIVSPYFQNVKLNNDSLIQPRKSINQYGNYSLFD